MRKARSLLVLCAVVALAGGGCVSLKRTPEARFFVLRAIAQPSAPADADRLPSPVGSAPVAAVASPASPPRPGGSGIGVLAVRIPEHLDRPQLVSWAGPNELRIDEYARWSEPLEAGIARTLVEDLGALLPQSRVVRAPWPVATPLGCRVATTVSAFGPEADGRVRLRGRFVLLAPREERVLGQRAFDLQRPGGSANGPGAAIETMSTLLADAAGQLAEALRELKQPGE